MIHIALVFYIIFFMPYFTFIPYTLSIYVLCKRILYIILYLGCCKCVLEGNRQLLCVCAHAHVCIHACACPLLLACATIDSLSKALSGISRWVWLQLTLCLRLTHSPLLPCRSAQPTDVALATALFQHHRPRLEPKGE